MVNDERLRILHVDQLTPCELDGLAKIYADVFAPPPWNEAVKCRSCDTFCGQEVELGSTCECGGTYVEAYPHDETVEYIVNEEGTNPGYRMAILEDDVLLGFSWSYLINPNNFVNHKWKLESDRCNIVDILRENGVDESMTFRYFSECGVTPSARGRGLANRLTDAVSGPETTIYRTNCNSPMMAVARRLGYSQIMGPEVEIDVEKKIVKTGGVINCMDNGNNDRTLFIRKSLD